MKENYNYILSKDHKIYYYDYDFLLNKSQIKSVDIDNLSQNGIIYTYNKCKDMKTTLGIKEIMEKDLGFELDIIQINIHLTYTKV